MKKEATHPIKPASTVWEIPWQVWPNVLFLLYIISIEPLVRPTLIEALGTDGGNILVVSILIIMLIAQTIGILAKTFIIRQRDVASISRIRQLSSWVVVFTVLNMCFTVLLWVLLFMYTSSFDASSVVLRLFIIAGIVFLVIRDIFVLVKLRQPMQPKEYNYVPPWVNGLAELHLVLFALLGYSLLWSATASQLQLNPIALAGEDLLVQVTVMAAAILVTVFLYVPLQYAYHIEQLLQARLASQYWQWVLGAVVFIALATAQLIVF